MNSISSSEMQEEGLTEEAQVTDMQPDEGFRYNPAVQKWRPDPGRYDPRLRDRMEEAIWD